MASNPIQSYPDIAPDAQTKVYAKNADDSIGWVDYPEDAQDASDVAAAVSAHDADPTAHGGIATIVAGHTTDISGNTSQIATNTGEIAANTADIANIEDVSAQVPPAGGDVGQVLAKASNTDYDYTWATTEGFQVSRFGAVGDGTTDDTAAIQSAIDAAGAVGGTVVLHAGRYLLDSAVPTLRIQDPIGLQFERGAVLVWGMEDVYYPAIYVESDDVVIDGATLEWTGALTVGAELDFTSAGPSGEVSPESTSRFGEASPIRKRDYCSGILAVERDNVEITNFTGYSDAGDSTSVIHQWIKLAECSNVTVNTARFDDCVLGVLSTGFRAEFRNLVGDRFNQDVGIYGHMIYAFNRYCIIDGVIDYGGDTSSMGSWPGTTIAYKSDRGESIITNVVSLRARGPLGLDTTNTTVSNVSWTDAYFEGDDDSDMSSEDAGAFHLLTGGNENYRLAVSNVRLHTTRDWLIPIKGVANNSSFSNLVIIRDDASAATRGFLAVRGDNNVFAAALVQDGADEAPVCSDWNGLARYSTYRLSLSGFGSPPVVDAANFSHNEIIITMRRGLEEDAGRAVAVLGSQAEFFPNPSTSLSTVCQINSVAFEDGSCAWQNSVAAASSVSEDFYFPPGTYLLEVMLKAETVNQKVVGTYLVTSNRIESESRTLTVAELDNSVVGAGITNFDVSIAANFVLTVSADLSGTAAANPTIVRVSGRRLS